MIRTYSYASEGPEVASELKSTAGTVGLSLSVGERVTMGDSDAEFVVISVDHEKGCVELLQLKPGRIESGILLSQVRKRDNGPQLVPPVKD